MRCKFVAGYSEVQRSNLPKFGQSLSVECSNYVIMTFCSTVFVVRFGWIDCLGFNLMKATMDHYFEGKEPCKITSFTWS